MTAAWEPGDPVHPPDMHHKVCPQCRAIWDTTSDAPEPCPNCGTSSAWEERLAATKPDRPNPFKGLECGECGVAALRLTYRLRAKPLGTYSLAGAQLKFAASPWPWCVCDNCGRESRGEPATPGEAE